MQGKIDCNNINEIRKDKNANSIYTVSVTLCAYVQFSSNPLEIFQCLCKNPFYNFWTLKESLSLVFRKLTIQETTSLSITIDFLRRTKRFLFFRVDNTIWSSWMNSQYIDLQVFVQELLREHLIMKFSWNISPFFKSNTHIYKSFVPFQNGLKRCVF